MLRTVFNSIIEFLNNVIEFITRFYASKDSNGYQLLVIMFHRMLSQVVKLPTAKLYTLVE